MTLFDFMPAKNIPPGVNSQKAGPAVIKRKGALWWWNWKGKQRL